MSFQSVSYQTHYLRVSQQVILLNEVEDSPRFREEASFRLREPFDRGTRVSFESASEPDKFLVRLAQSFIRLAGVCATSTCKKEASWYFCNDAYRWKRKCVGGTNLRTYSVSTALLPVRMPEFAVGLSQLAAKCWVSISDRFRCRSL